MKEQSLSNISNDFFSGNSEGTVTTSTNSPFLEEIPGGKVKCYGRIVEVNHQDLFYSKIKKLLNSVFRGEPYQFGYQISEYLIRVEDIGNPESPQRVDFCLYGNYMGRLINGDEVWIIAKDGSGRRIVKFIYNASTQSQIHPGIQLPANVVRISLLIFAITMGYLIFNVISYFHTDAGKYTLLLMLAIIGGGISLKRWIKRKIFKP